MDSNCHDYNRLKFTGNQIICINDSGANVFGCVVPIININNRQSSTSLYGIRINSMKYGINLGIADSRYINK